MWKGMKERDCGERDEVRGMWGRDEGGDCAESDERRGLWGRDVFDETVRKGMQGGDCEEKKSLK